MRLPPAHVGTVLRLLATNDLGASLVPVRTSFGESGTCAAVAALLEEERARQPTLWLDSGDLTFGPLNRLLGERPWSEVATLPIAAAAAGNHEFDDGVEALLDGASRLGYPLLCANVDVGLPPSVVVESGAGPLGVIGLTHPRVDRFCRAPAPAEDWPARVADLAADLRGQGARWVVALLHDGADWWPGGPATGTRVDRLERVVAPWAAHVDLILGAHTLVAWTGALAGTPAGHGHSHAASVLVADLSAPPARPVVRGCFPLAAVRPSDATPGVAALDAAAANVVGESRGTWRSRTGAERYLPGLVAGAMRRATGADAAVFLPGSHATQAPVDGAHAALLAGPVSELDLLRLFDGPDDRPRIVALRPGELEAFVNGYGAIADPHNRAADAQWWNWCRMPVAVSAGAERPESVAMLSWNLPRIAEVLGRELDGEPAAVGVRDALLAALAAQDTP